MGLNFICHKKRTYSNVSTAGPKCTYSTHVINMPHLCLMFYFGRNLQNMGGKTLIFGTIILCYHAPSLHQVSSDLACNFLSDLAYKQTNKQQIQVKD